MKVYWLSASEAGVPPGDHWLSERESAALDRLNIPKRRADWRLGRWTAKRAIAAHRRLPPEQDALAAIEVWPASSGAPEAFLEGLPANLIISLSHSHGTGFCTVAAPGAALGCDVERVTPRAETFLADYFTPEEQQLVERSPAVERPNLMTLLWSAKESVLKALECGLRSDTRSVLTLPGQMPKHARPGWRPLAAREASGRVFHGWWQQTGDLVWTVMSAPPAFPPIALV